MMAGEGPELSNLVVALTAVVGAVLALSQLRATARISRGTQLMAIDQQIEGPLVESPRAILEMRFACAELAASNGSTLEDEASAYLEKLIAARKLIGSPDPDVAKAAAASFDRHFLIMRLPMFIETIGVLVAEELADGHAALSLYGAMIDSSMRPIMPHIIRQRTARDNPDLLIHAEQLYCRPRERLRLASLAQQRRAIRAGQ